MIPFARFPSLADEHHTQVTPFYSRAHALSVLGRCFLETVLPLIKQALSAYSGSFCSP